MPPAIEPGSGLIYMKVGTHAQEPLEEIIARKRREIEEAGHAFWGYGGNTCHPQKMVQPFAKSYDHQGSTIYLYMEPMESKHFALPVRADEYSVDGLTWHLVPSGINALGSRYALVIDEIREENITLSLSKTRVALGNSTGKCGAAYIKGRVDKACLEVTSEVDVDCEDRSVDIRLVARIIDPYAVYLRNRPAR